MGVVISFSDLPREDVLLAGWAFRQLQQDVLARSSGIPDLTQAFEYAQVINGLFIRDLKPEIAEAVVRTIRTTAEDILSGAAHSGITTQPFGNNETVAAYREGLRRILQSLPADATSKGAIN